MQELFTSAPVATVIFAVTIILSVMAFERKDVMRQLILHPYTFLGDRKYYTLMTSGFIHADWFHLIFNMLAFYYFAFPLEAIMTAYAGSAAGHVYFALLYFVCMALADVPSIIKHRYNPQYASLGASGAIAGVIFSMIIFNPDMRIAAGLLPIPMKAPLFGIVYLAGSAFSITRRYDNINHSAHFWGAIWGLVITAIAFPEALKSFLEYIRHWIGM